jgi:hypothetical protein
MQDAGCRMQDAGCRIEIEDRRQGYFNALSFGPG